MPFAPYSQTVQRVAESLRTTFDALDPWFDRPAAERSYKPADGGWSIDEILEHITLTSHFLLIVIRNSTRKALRRAETRSPVPDGESNLDLLEPIGQRGAFAWSRPEHMIPTGAVPATQVRQTLRDQAEECLALLSQLQAGEGSFHKVRMSVNQSGRLDIYQWLYFLAQHALRHISQMEAVAAEWQVANPQ